MDRLSGVTLLEEAATRLQKNVLGVAILILKSIPVVLTGKELSGWGQGQAVPFQRQQVQLMVPPTNPPPPHQRSPRPRLCLQRLRSAVPGSPTCQPEGPAHLRSWMPGTVG